MPDRLMPRATATPYPRTPPRMQLARILSVVAVALCLARAAADDPQPRILNPDTATYDHHLHAVETADGGNWVAWHAYRHNRDQIMVRQIAANGQLGEILIADDQAEVHSPPHVVAHSPDTVSVIWSRRLADRWQIVMRRHDAAGWHPLAILSDAAHDAIWPAAIKTDDGGLLVAWAERTEGRFQIVCSRVRHDVVGRPQAVSDPAVDAHRPVLAIHEKQTWVAWDQYLDGQYSVQARRLSPEMEPIEQISPVGEHCLTPVLLSHSTGLHAAWLRKIDVIGGRGVISQWHTLHAAIRDESGWTTITDSDGESAAAELTHGLMAKIDPQPVATGGYLGARARPLLLATTDHVWLAWERKSDHRGSTAAVGGDLAARRIQRGHWQPTVLLTTDLVDYRTCESDHASDQFRLVASRLPRGGQRRYEMLTVDPAATGKFEQEQWTGWSPVALPNVEEQPPRRSIRVGDRTFQIYWADLHCHNGLTADAEGPPDEQTHYARDKALLDVVVFTNNDFYNVPLTRYEYELGHLLANTYTHDRQFLSLPGFEWTSRIPGVADARLSDPGNWLPPYRNRSFPNHRSVIYPPAGGPLVHFPEVGNDIGRLNELVEQAGGLTLTQHNAFQTSRHAVEVGLELTSGWSNYIDARPELFHAAIDQRPRLGFVANGDTHRRAPGLSGALTAILAEELTPEHILEALRQRRCYATMGSHIWIDARIGDAVMGEEIELATESVPLRLQVQAPRPIRKVTLIRNGQAIHEVDGENRRQLQVEFTDTPGTSQTWSYYWRIEQQQATPPLPGNLMVAHGHLAWSSPHWVTLHPTVESCSADQSTDDVADSRPNQPTLDSTHTVFEYPKTDPYDRSNLYGFNHGPSVVELPDGHLLAAWFSGPYEASVHQVVLASTSKDGGRTWSPAEVLHDTPRYSNFDPAFIRDGQTVWSFYSIGRWTRYPFLGVGSSPTMVGADSFRLFGCRSSDSGKSWSPAVQLSEDTGWNCRSNGIALKNGDLVLPIHNLNAPHIAAVLRSSDKGKTWARSETISTPGRIGAAEPSVAEAADGELLMVLRTRDGVLWTTRSSDHGETWAAAEKTELTAAAASHSLIRLRDGSLALTHNPTAPPLRTELTLRLSSDAGRSWNQPLEIARIKPAKLTDEIWSRQVTYPSAVQLTDGNLLIVWTEIELSAGMQRGAIRAARVSLR